MNRKHSGLNSSIQDEQDFEKAKDSFQRWRRRERLPKTSAELLSRLIARSGLGQIQWNQQLQDAWQTSLTSELAGKTSATMVKRGVLEVLVESSSAMQQLAFEKQALLDKVRQKLPEANIKSIRFRVGRVQ